MEGHDEWCLLQGGHGRQTLYSAGGTVLATVVGRQFERERESGGFERKRECGREKGNDNGQPRREESAAAAPPSSNIQQLPLQYGFAKSGFVIFIYVFYINYIYIEVLGFYLCI